MSHLFIIEEKKVFPNPETLLIYPFKEIWERDKSENKENAISEFGYIEFMGSFRQTNPYRAYPDEVKGNKIRIGLGIDVNWQPDELIEQGIIKIIEFETEASITYSYYMAAKAAAENMRDFFNKVDITEKNFKTGNPIYKPKDITSAIIDTDQVLAKLVAMEKKVKEENMESIKNKADKVISPFADPDNFKQN